MSTDLFAKLPSRHVHSASLHLDCCIGYNSAMSLMQQCLRKAMSAAKVVCLSEVPYLSLKPLSLSGRLNSLLIELSALSMGHSQLLLQVSGTHPQLLHLQ